MADPATVIQVISASTSLVAQCAKVIKGLHDLAAKYKSAELSIRATAHELDTIRLAWERIENTLRSWEGNEGSDDELLQRLNQKLDFGALIVASLDEDMTTFTKRPFTFTQRSKYVWTESKFKDHQDRIRGQVLAMNLLVSVLKMPSAVERLSLLHNGAEVLRKSDESAYAIVPSRISSRLPSVYSNPSSLSIESAELVYRRLSVDDDLFTARVYKRNYRHPLMNFLMKPRPSTSLRMRERLSTAIVHTGTPKHPVQRASSESQIMFSNDREEESLPPPPPPHSTCASILERSDKFDRVIIPSSTWTHTTRANTIVGPAVSTDLVYVYKESCTYQTRNLSESVLQCQPDDLAHLLRLLAWGFHSWRKWYLHQACIQKKADLVQLLIDDDRSLGRSLITAQEDLNGYYLDEGGLRLLRTKMGKDAVSDDVARAQFDKACSEGRHRSVRSLLPYGLPSSHDLLFAAAYNLDCHTVAFLLQNGFDANAKSEDGQTCLLKVASRPRSHGLDSSRSFYGLDWPDAVSSRLIDILLEHGADVETTANNGDNFYHLVAQREVPAVIFLHSLPVGKTQLSSALAALNQHGETPAAVAEKRGNHQFLAFVDDVDPLIKGTSCNASSGPKPEMLSFPTTTCLPSGSSAIDQHREETSAAVGAEQLGNEQFLPVESHVDQAVKGTYSAHVGPQAMLSSFPTSRLPNSSNEIDLLPHDIVRMKRLARNSI